MSDETILHVGPDSGIGERIGGRIGEIPDLDVEECQSVAEAEQRVIERGVDCLVSARELPDGTGTELVAVAREEVPDLGAVLYGDERPTIERPDSQTSIVEFVPTDSETAVDRIVTLAAMTARTRTQTTYPQPDDEAERLESLEKYDVASDETFQRLQEIVDEAATELDAPQATINVIGKAEQSFAVSHDAEWPSIPRQDSICTYSILSDEPTVIADALNDPRFEGIDALAESGIRSYAGAPIEPDDGCPIATLCVYDETPDRFSGDDARYLQSLARDAAEVIAHQPNAGAEVRR